MKKKIHLITKVPKNGEIFKQKSSAAYWKNKLLSNYLTKIHNENQQLHYHVSLFWQWKVYLKNTAKIITNDKISTEEKAKDTGNCKVCSYLCYAMECSKNFSYIFYTGEELSECFVKRCYVIKNRAYSSKITNYFYDALNTNAIYYWKLIILQIIANLLSICNLTDSKAYNIGRISIMHSLTKSKIWFAW